jgi:CBS domain-containing protein
MSPRAAWRLEALGFDQVYDYAAGKADWGAADLPREGTVASEASAGDAADHDVPTCSLSDELRAVRERVRAAGWDQCIVVNEHRIVLGRLGRNAIASGDERSVEDVMQEGPSTVRPNVRLTELEQRLERQGLRSALVTTNDGRLVGVVRRAGSGSAS